MYIHKKGYGVIATVIIIAAVIAAAFFLFVPIKLIQTLIVIACSALVFWSFTFCLPKPDARLGHSAVPKQSGPAPGQHP